MHLLIRNITRQVPFIQKNCIKNANHSKQFFLDTELLHYSLININKLENIKKQNSFKL